MLKTNYTKIGYIYLIENTVTGKQYIGKTENTITYRFSQHRRDAKRGCEYHLHRSMRKHGDENFIIKIIYIGPTEKLSDLEIFYIDKFNTFKNGYNMTIGGEGLSSPSKKTREKMRMAKRGFVPWNKGKTGVYSDQILKKMSERQKGKKHSVETRIKMGRVVIQIDTHNKIINEFPTATIAAETIGYRVQDDLNSRYHHSHGFFWVYKDQYDSFVNYKMEYEKLYKNSRTTKRVCQLTKDDKIIRIYHSVKEAERIIGKQGIAKVANNLPSYKTIGGFIWKWVD